MTVSKFKRGQNIRVITVANKPVISSLKNDSFPFPSDQLPYTTIAVYCDIGVYCDVNLPKQAIIKGVKHAQSLMDAVGNFQSSIFFKIYGGFLKCCGEKFPNIV